MNMNRLRTWLVAVCAASSMLGGMPGPAIAQAQVDVTVTGLTKVADTRVGRTQFDYVFRLTLHNHGAADAQNVRVTLTAAGNGTVIIDGQAVAGNIAAGGTVTPTDTVTLRQNREVPFDRTALAWRIDGDTGTSVPGILLPGPPTRPATETLIDYRAERGTEQMVTGVDPDTGVQFFRALLIAVIRADATVGEVNDALVASGAKISAMWLRDRAVTLSIPPAADWHEALATADRLMATGAFETARPPTVWQPNQLPPGVLPLQAISPEGPILHHLAVGAPAAWNAIAAVQNAPKVSVIVADYFGNGGGVDVNGRILNYTGGFAEGELCTYPDGVRAPCAHGYHVLGIIDGSWGGTGPVGQVTGMLPTGLGIHIIDLTARGNETFEEYFKSKLRLAVSGTDAHDRFVLNLSLGYCSPPASTCLLPRQAAFAANDWQEMTRTLLPGFDFESQVLVVSAAGNGGRLTSAYNNSGWNAAVLADAPEARLANGLVVENIGIGMDANGTPAPGSRAESSTTGGNVSAVGQNVYSFLSPVGAGRLSGTSMAAPQVTGLAAYMLALRPALTAPQLVNMIRSSRYLPADPSAPAVDAYGAVLGVDESSSPNVFDAPVRLALLQPGVPDPQPQFGIDDARRLLDAFFPSVHGGSASVTPEFAVEDLNGDGFVGHPERRAPFNLQLEAPGARPEFGPVTRYANGINVALDERGVTDFEILCYYVNSSLFREADRAAFEQALAAIAAHPSINRTISCNAQAAKLYVDTTVNGWRHLPADITLKDLWPTTATNFRRVGNSATNTCGTGERGAPLFSFSVPANALFYGARTVTGVPEPDSGPSIGYRNCSSFVAMLEHGQATPQVWINGTGRARLFVGQVSYDWEISGKVHERRPRASLGRQTLHGRHGAKQRYVCRGVRSNPMSTRHNDDRVRISPQVWSLPSRPISSRKKNAARRRRQLTASNFSRQNLNEAVSMALRPGATPA